MSRNKNSRKNWLITLLIFTVLLVAIALAMPRFHGVHADTAASHVATLRENLLADPTSVSGHWLRTLNPLVKNVQGDVVWNSTTQQGVLRISELPKPKAGTFYQLWLYDAQSDAAEGISGGVLTQGVSREELFALIKTDEYVREPYKFELKLQNTGSNNSTDGQVLLMMQP